MTMRMNDEIKEAASRAKVDVDVLTSTRSGIRVYVTGSNVDRFRELLSNEYGYVVSRGFIDGTGYVIDVN